MDYSELDVEVSVDLKSAPLKAQDANDSNMTLEEWILKNISDYATTYSALNNQFSEVIPEINNAHNGTSSEYVDDVLKKAGVKL